MPQRLYRRNVPACDGSLTVALNLDETLVHDVRAGLTPAQMVEHKLMALLNSSDLGVFARSGEWRDVERKLRGSFQMAEAIQEGRQRAATDRRIRDSAAKRTAVPFLQMVAAPMPELALLATLVSQAGPLIRPCLED